MKPAASTLGLKIQQIMLENRVSVEALAQDICMSPDSLSNLIHGRRRFKDDTLERIAATKAFVASGMTIQKLKAYRAMGDYDFPEIILAFLEYTIQGEVDKLPNEFFEHLGLDPEHKNLSEVLEGKSHLLKAYTQSRRR
ncbi:MAG: helix-turn-helix domain-containing protein [Candidatus Melainabacteria bacterium]